MSELRRLVLDPDPRCRSREAGLFLAQIENLHEKLASEIRDASVEELGWQLHPGANTMAMLATHVAISEVHLIDVGVRLMATSDLIGTLGMDETGDGMPLPAGAPPPAQLAGRTAEELLALLAKARGHSAHFVAGLAEPDLDRRSERQPAHGSRYAFNVRWMLHHVQEHLAGHLAQVQLLRTAYRRQEAPTRH